MPARALPSVATATPARSAGLRETPGSRAVKQEVRHAVVGHEHVRPPVIVEVGDDDAEAVAAIARRCRTAALTSVKTPLPSLR